MVAQTRPKTKQDTKMTGQMSPIGRELFTELDNPQDSFLRHLLKEDGPVLWNFTCWMLE